MKEFVLKVAQDGLAVGNAFPIRADVEPVRGKDIDKEKELAGFEAAVAVLDTEISNAAMKADPDSAPIYETEKLLLEDPEYADAIRDLIRSEGIDAITAVRRTGEALAKELGENSSEYISQRREDVDGLTVRLISILRGEEQQVLDTPAIITAEELSPAQLSALDGDMILGIVTVKGAPTSHVAILAGNLGIPYLYGSGEAIAAITEGEGIILDGNKLITDPDEETFRNAARRLAEQQARKEKEAEHPSEDGRKTKVYANIAGAHEIDALLSSGAEGVGLFRTEFLFLGQTPPSEEEQFETYRAVAEAMDGKEVVIRTMDLGSDKKANWLRMPDEKNPALGCRGLRLSLKEEKLFREQLRALLRAAACGNVRVMIPMVASVWELDAVRAQIDSCAEEFASEGVTYRKPALGIMVETPAAAMIADQLAEKADFFSIGTNDLNQYTLALDREAEDLDSYYDPCHEAILRLIEMTAKAGHEKGIPTAVCGELASNPEGIEELIKRGVDELSVAVSKVEQTKRKAAEAEESLSREQSSGKDALQTAEVTLAAPADGKLIPMEDIPDEVFASGTLGECVGILPENGKIYAPCDGVVSDIADTKHAVTFSSSDGMKILIHAGIDTVTLKGEGFTVLVEEGQTVQKGDVIMEADLDVIRKAGLSTMVIMVRSS